MAEQTELGPESSAAHAEVSTGAGASDINSALAAFAADQGITPGAEAEPEAEASTSDATAAAQEEGGDYNEEDHVDPPSEQDEPTTAAAPDGDEWPEDIKKTWDQYPNERERAKALAENKRYGIEQAERAKQLEAELADLRGKGGTTAAPASESTETQAQPTQHQPLNAEPTAEDVRTAIDRLSQQDPVVAEAVESLGSRRAELVEKQGSLNTLRTEIKTAESDHAELVANIKYLEKKLAGRPDDFALQEELDDVRAQATRLATQIDSKAIRAQRLSGDINELDNRYRRDLAVLRDVGLNEHHRTRAQEESDRTFTERRDKEVKTWKDSFASLATDLKIPEDLREEANEILLLKATHHAGDIEDVPTWMRENAGLVTKMLEKHRASVLREYGDLKRADATQPAPKGPAAVAPRQEQRPMSSREADRIASQSLRRQLGGR